MENDLASFSNSPMKISALDPDELMALFRNANVEAEKMEALLSEIVNAHERIEMLEVEKRRKNQKTIKLVLSFLFAAIFVVSGVAASKEASTITMLNILIGAVAFLAIGVFISIFIREKHRRIIDNEWENVSITAKEAEFESGQCKYIPLIPNDYRTSLALKTMMKYLMNGQAENWKECSLLYDQQLHRWTLEQNSAEALEFQKQAAWMTELAAKNSSRAATAATISAASSILRWFI